MKNIEKYSIRNEFAFTAHCMFPVLFFLRYHQGHSQKYKSFFPKAILLFNINLLSTSKLLFNDITLSFWGLF